VRFRSSICVGYIHVFVVTPIVRDKIILNPYLFLLNSQFVQVESHISLVKSYLLLTKPSFHGKIQPFSVHQKMGHSCREAKILEKMILYQQLGRHCPDILDDKNFWFDLTHNYGKIHHL